MLNIDLFFHAALNDSDVISATGGRIFNTERPDKDDQEDRIPYIVVAFEGATSGVGNKDEMLSDLSQGTVTVMCCATDRESLATLTDLVHEKIEDALVSTDYDDHEDWNFRISGCTLNAGPVEYDSSKPCHWEVLTYVCDTERK